MNKIYTPQREQSAVLGDPELRGAGGGGVATSASLSGSATN